MSLYDGVDIDGVPMQSNATEGTDITKLSGWSSSYKLLQTQLQRKKVAQTRPVSTSRTKAVNQVVLGIKRSAEDLEDSTVSDLDGREILVSYELLLLLRNHVQGPYCSLWTWFLPVLLMDIF
ncbi:uncharacterized protein LOC111340895 [Stylophora pistillata]|uniref:uncharacterized protein LOC111340895 n=1 Tax=Stylophora pistillata TaxID=50429 RepID=UPI000C0565DE|nr:uncharacterized protein LOC111340895 [Stylophora pistillata]